MILRIIVAHIILPIIMLVVSISGIINPMKVYKSKIVAKSFRFKRLEKNENTITNAIFTNCICLLVEGLLYSILSIMVLCGKIEISSFQTFLLIIIMVVIELPVIFIAHFIKFDKFGEVRGKKK